MLYERSRKDHTVLTASKHKGYLALLHQPQSITAHCPCSLRLPTERWPGWIKMGSRLCTLIFRHRKSNPDTITHPSTNRPRQTATTVGKLKDEKHVSNSRQKDDSYPTETMSSVNQFQIRRRNEKARISAEDSLKVGINAWSMNA